MSYSARGDREHSFRITTARQKNQCFRTVDRVRARIDTTCSVSTSARDARDASGSARARSRKNFFNVSKNIDKIRVFEILDVCATAESKARTRAARARGTCRKPRVKHTQRLVQKFSVKRLANRLQAVESDTNSSESTQSDSPRPDDRRQIADDGNGRTEDAEQKFFRRFSVACRPSSLDCGRPSDAELGS